jgi:NAD(P)-dependent dehydrogenase (short-subunit alcohol dehydrogenase family)
MTTTLEGSTALVTGATAGIGRAVAMHLARLGAEIVVHGRSAERGAEVVQEIQNVGGKARFIAADLGNADDVRRLAAEAGPVDILINNAGVYKFGATVDTDDAFFDEQVNINCAPPTSWSSSWYQVWPNEATAPLSTSARWRPLFRQRWAGSTGRARRAWNC